MHYYNISSLLHTYVLHLEHEQRRYYSHGELFVYGKPRKKTYLAVSFFGGLSQIAPLRCAPPQNHARNTFLRVAVLCRTGGSLRSRIQFFVRGKQAKKKDLPCGKSFFLVAPPRLELGTQGSSGLCSTN
jgi:hypothetical protein